VDSSIVIAPDGELFMHKLHPHLPGLHVGIEQIQHGLTGNVREVASEQKNRGS
jgi:hypothetical protein